MILVYVVGLGHILAPAKELDVCGKYLMEFFVPISLVKNEIESGNLIIIHRQLGGRPSRSGGLSNCIVVKGFGQK